MSSISRGFVNYFEIIYKNIRNMLKNENLPPKQRENIIIFHQCQAYNSMP